MGTGKDGGGIVIPIRGDVEVKVEGVGEEEKSDNVVKVLFSPIGLSECRSYDKRPYCQHAQSEVDDVARRVTCKACGAELDPITVLMKLARRGDALHWTREEEKRIKERILELQAEEKRIKDRIRNAKKKDPGGG